MYYYVKNIQGDIIKIVSEDGCLAYTYDYDAWGALLSIKDNQGHTISGNSTSLATTNPLRYRGYVYDDETGLYYLQSRYYDPKTGRFLNADVYFDTGSGSSLSTNMFSYCENCPLYKIDTNGKDVLMYQVVSEAYDKPFYAWLLGLNFYCKYYKDIKVNNNEVKQYDLFNNNCLHVSLDALLNGSFVYSNERDILKDIRKDEFIPNKAYNKLFEKTFI